MWKWGIPKATLGERTKIKILNNLFSIRAILAEIINDLRKSITGKSNDISQEYLNYREQIIYMFLPLESRFQVVENAIKEGDYEKASKCFGAIEEQQDYIKKHIARIAGVAEGNKYALRDLNVLQKLMETYEKNLQELKAQILKEALK